MSDKALNFARAFLKKREAEDVLSEAKQEMIANSLDSKQLPAVIQVQGVTVIVLGSPDMGQPRPVLIAKTVVT